MVGTPRSSRMPGHQIGQEGSRVGRPVAVVTAVEITWRAKDRDLDIGDAPDPKYHLRSTALMDRPVADHPDVGAQADRRAD